MSDRKPLVGGVVITQGDLGRELVEAARRAADNDAPLVSVSLSDVTDSESASRQIEEAMRKVDNGGGVILMTDTFGGATSNLAFAFLEQGRCEVITGVNLPMVLGVAEQTGEDDLAGLAQSIRDSGRDQIAVASELLSA